MYRLEPGEPIGPGLQRIWKEKLFESTEILRNFDAAPKLAVHSIRKNVKRIRALLRLVEPAVGVEIYRAENYRFRDIGRLFGGLRDSSVLSETAVLLAAAEDDEPPPFPAILERLAALSDRAYNDEARISASVAEALDRFMSATARSVQYRFDATGAEVYRGYDKTVRAARKGYRRAAHRSGATGVFHEWRKQVKYVWHQLEILAPAADRPVEELTGDVQHLAGLLGQAHDAAALQAWLPKAAGDVPRSEVDDLSARLRRYRLDQEGAALAHGAMIFGNQGEVLTGAFAGLSDYPAPTGQ